MNPQDMGRPPTESEIPMTTTEDRGPSCKDRVEESLASRVASLNEINEGIRSLQEGTSPVKIGGVEIDNEDDAVEFLNNFASGVSFKATMTVRLWTGGPGDQFEIEVEVRKSRWGWELAENEATYRLSHHHDGASVTTDDETVMRYLRSQIERVSETETTDDLFC